MSEFIGLTIAGLSLGAILAIAASGLVVTYTTSGVFNFAHGAIGMVMAFVYWQLRVHLHWSGPVSMGLALFVIAPAIGFVLQWALIRHINVNDAGLTLVVTLAILVALMGIAFTLWPQNTGRSLPLLFGQNRHVTIDGSRISYEELLSIGLAALTAVGLRLLFFKTRIGMAMRGVVDDRPLIALNGGSPAALSALSWMIGAALGGLAGILTATTYALDILNLTLLVLNSFAAAMLGRLRNLPLTFLGAMVLGLADAYVTGYLNLSGWLAHLRPVLPTLFLFIVLLALPAVRLRTGTAPAGKAVRVPSARGSLLNGALLVAAALIAAPLMHGTVLGNVSEGVALGIGALSIVLLSGYGGQVSLAQYTFFGFGAWVFAHAGHGGNPVGLLVAAIAGAALGVLVALPALRLRGLELALSTLAFGQLAYYMFFLQPSVMGRSDLVIPRVHLPGLALHNDRTNLVFLVVVFSLLSAGLLALRRGRFGRMLLATKDSDAACATMGFNVRLGKVALFSLATAIATFGGALYGSTQHTVTSDNFQYIASLFIVLIVYIWGVSAPGAALAGGLSLAVAPLLALHIPTRFSALTYFLTGFGALGLVLRPEGVIAMIGDQARGWWRRLPHARVPDTTPAAIVVPGYGRPAQPWGALTMPVLETQGITVRFGGAVALAVGVTADVGTVTGLIGPNGAGKTTLFNVITGLRTPDSGRVIFDDRDVTSVAVHRRARLGMARTFQRLETLGSLSVRDNIQVAGEMRRLWSRERFDVDRQTHMILEQVGLQQFADASASTLPTGLARLTELGRALATRPRLLLLDEPGSGLDIAESETFGRLLGELTDGGLGILLVEHDMELVMNVCSIIHVLDFGAHLTSGTPQEVRSDARVQEAYLGAPVSRSASGGHATPTTRTGTGR